MDRRANPAPHRRGGGAITETSSSEIVVTAPAAEWWPSTALLVGILGPWASPAFAGWSARTDGPSSSQLSAAEDELLHTWQRTWPAQPGAPASATLPPVALSDARGPYSLIVYGTTNPSMCVAGANVDFAQPERRIDGDGERPSMGPERAERKRSIDQSSQLIRQCLYATVFGHATRSGGAVTVDHPTTPRLRTVSTFTVTEGQVGSRGLGSDVAA